MSHIAPWSGNPPDQIGSARPPAHFRNTSIEKNSSHRRLMPPRSPALKLLRVSENSTTDKKRPPSCAQVRDLATSPPGWRRIQPTPTCPRSYMARASDSFSALLSHVSFICFSTIAENMK